MTRTKWPVLFALILVGGCVNVVAPPDLGPRWGGGDRFLLLSSSGALDFSFESVAVFHRWESADPADGRRWVVRHETAQGGRDALSVVSWADSRTCPGIIPLLEAAETMQGTTIDLPGIGVFRSPSGMLDGRVVVLKTDWAVADDAHLDVEITGNVDSPAYRWWAENAVRLEGCWSRSEPH